MESLKQLRNMYALHHLILTERTGTSYELAQILNVCRRTVMNYMCELRDLGAVIEYDNSRNTFYYVNNFEIYFEFNIKIS